MLSWWAEPHAGGNCMKVIIFGASGRTGRLIAERAGSQGHVITAFVHTPKKAIHVHEAFELVVGDVRKVDQVMKAIEGHDAVICAVGGDGKTVALAAQNIVAGMLKHGVKRLIFLSMAGIHGEVPGLQGWWRQRQLAVQIADHKSAALAIAKTHLRWTLIRPITMDDSSGRYSVRVANEGVPKGGTTISRMNVARFIADTLDQDLYIRQEPCVTF